jgi:hypothetical protein
MQRLYEPRAYYQRIRTFLEVHTLQGPRELLTWRDIQAVARSFWTVGLRHGGRRAYWSFLAGTLFRRPRQLGVALTLAIMGHHFRMVAAGL